MNDPQTIKSSTNGDTRKERASLDIRCECHRLLARLDGEQLELRCPRCKRKVLLDLKELLQHRTIPTSLQFE
jgi:phage FluMu protein Com